MTFLKDPYAVLPIELSTAAWIIAAITGVITVVVMWRYVRGADTARPLSVQRRWRWHIRSLVLGTALALLNACDLSFSFDFRLLPVINAIAAAMLIYYAGQLRFGGLLMSWVALYLYASSLAWCLAVSLVAEHTVVPNALWVLLSNLSWVFNYLLLVHALIGLLIYPRQMRCGVRSRRVRKVIEAQQQVQKALASLS